MKKTSIRYETGCKKQNVSTPVKRYYWEHGKHNLRGLLTIVSSETCAKDIQYSSAAANDLKLLIRPNGMSASVGGEKRLPTEHLL